MSLCAALLEEHCSRRIGLALCTKCSPDTDGVLAVPPMTTELLRRLQSSRLFAELDGPVQERLAQGASVRTLPAGERVFREGDAAEHVHILLSGLVEIRRATEAGGEALLGLFGPREVFGLSAALERSTYPADAIVVSEYAEVLRVQSEPVLALLPESTVLAAAVNRALLEHTRALRAKIDIMSAGAVPRRLALLFSYLAERFGDEDEQGALFIPISLSRAQLAHLVGARVETVIRTVSRWQKEGLLKTDRDGFELKSPDVLEGLLGAEG